MTYLASSTRDQQHISQQSRQQVKSAQSFRTRNVSRSNGKSVCPLNAPITWNYATTSPISCKWKSEGPFHQSQSLLINRVFDRFRLKAFNTFQPVLAKTTSVFVSFPTHTGEGGFAVYGLLVGCPIVRPTEHLPTFVTWEGAHISLCCTEVDGIQVATSTCHTACVKVIGNDRCLLIWKEQRLELVSLSYMFMKKNKDLILKNSLYLQDANTHV